METQALNPSILRNGNFQLNIKIVLALLLQIVFASIQIQNATAAPLAIKNQARQNLKLGNSQQAIDLLNRNSNLAGADSEYYFLKGRAFQDLRRNTDALANYSIAIYLNPKFVNAFINRGLVRGALQDVNGALIDLDQALLLQPNNTAALLNRGVTYGGLNKPSLAIQDFNKAIQINPNYADAFRNRGLTKHLLGDKDGACDDWYKSKNLGINEATEWLTKYCMQQK